MIVLSHGMAKSASSFAAQITLGLINIHCKNAGVRHFSLSDFFDFKKNMFIDDGEDIDAMLRYVLNDTKFHDDDFLVIKLHMACTPFVKSLIDSKIISAISSYRDPRDVALSLIDAAKIDESRGLKRFVKYKELRDTVDDIDYQIDCLKTWSTSSKTLFLAFTDLASKPYDVAYKISKHLCIDFNKSVVDGLISDKTNIWEYNKGKEVRWVDEFGEMDDVWNTRINNFYDFVRQIAVSGAE